MDKPRFYLYNLIWAAIGGGLFVFAIMFPSLQARESEKKIPDYFDGTVIEAQTRYIRGGEVFWGGWVIIERDDGWRKKFETDEEQALNCIKGRKISVNLDTGEMEPYRSFYAIEEK